MRTFRSADNERKAGIRAISDEKQKVKIDQNPASIEYQHEFKGDIKMNLDAVLSALIRDEECRKIFRKLNEDSFQKMRVCIKAVAAYEDIEDRFFECCNRTGLMAPAHEDTGISPSDVMLIATQLIKIKTDKQKPGEFKGLLINRDDTAAF
jgi:hypothetical protein